MTHSGTSAYHHEEKWPGPRLKKLVVGISNLRQLEEHYRDLSDAGKKYVGTLAGYKVLQDIIDNKLFNYNAQVHI